MKNRKHFLFDIDCISSGDGSLVVVEENKQVPFKIKRLFYEYGVTGEKGNHANKKSRFCLIAVSGSCEVVVNDGHENRAYLLDKPTKGLYLDKMVWKVMKNFSNDCVLLVLSDCLYDKNEYIRNFEDYLKQIA